MSISAMVDARLTWTYEATDERITNLYRQALTSQWNVDTAIDWSVSVEYGAPLPDTSPRALAAFAESPFRARGRAAWDRFRWELQLWTISQVLHGEQGALLGAARLAELLPDIESKRLAATQAVDEARHVDVFARYLRHCALQAYPVSPPLASLLDAALRDRRWELTTLGINIVIEPLALATFRMSDETFHDELARSIVRRVSRDEARHASFGIALLRDVNADLTSAERREREEFVVEAADLMSRRFELDEVWARLDVPLAVGRQFARDNATMVEYRQALFTKVITTLARVGLLTPYVFGALDSRGLVGAAVRRLVRERSTGE